ncbi:MAG: hypothetical protein GKS02_13310 [Alphaproteobacteria bacterium]|nr:hypothetical protein [Alphaproteobacteria bacterium]
MQYSITSALIILLGLGFISGVAHAKKQNKESVTTIDCDNSTPGNTITAALKGASPGVTLTIEFTGTCRENVTILSDDVVLQGVGPAISRIEGVPEVDVDDSPVTILGAERVVIDNVNVSNGETAGIAVTTGSVTVTNSVLENNLQGIFVGMGSRARIDSNVIQGNTFNGIDVAYGGFAEIINNTVQNNDRNGAIVRDGASAWIGQDVLSNAGANIISNNQQNGILVFAGGSARISNNTVTSNNASTLGAGGILISEATARLTGNNTITGNTESGILVIQGVLRTFTNFAGGETISGNTIDGVIAINASSLEIQNATIENNGRDGIILTDNSTLRLGNSIIQSNGANAALPFRGRGLLLRRDSGARSLGGNTVLGAAGASDVQCLDTESSQEGFVGSISCTGF